MLCKNRRLRNADISRLFRRTQTQKIPAYPFVYFVGKQRVSTHAQRGIQLSTKLSKDSVKRHILKRTFYDCIVQAPIQMQGYYVLAVPQKAWAEEMTQVLATQSKTTIVAHVQKDYIVSLSSLAKKLGCFVESNAQGHPSNNANAILKETKKSS